MAEAEMTKNSKNEDPFVLLGDVEPKDVKWFWEPYIPYGMITIMEGDPNIGKSYLAMHLAAQVSIGGRLPGSKKLARRKVLYLTMEDDAGYTIRPRIDALGGDPNRIWVQDGYLAFDDDGLEKLRKMVRKIKPGLIVIDPLFQYVPGGRDPYKPNVIRELLGKVAEISTEVGAATLIIRHITKGGKEKAIYRGIGSIDVIGFARSAILVSEHPEDPELRAMLHLKHNLSPRGKGRVFRLVKKQGHKLPVVKWAGFTDLKPEDLYGSPQQDPKALEGAMQFIKDSLSDGRKRARDVKLNAETRSISKRTLDRAKKEIRVVSRKIGNKWYWWLPENQE